MKIGLVIATIDEFKTLFDNLEYKYEFIDNGNFKVYKYKINNHDVYVMNSGIGEISAAISTQFLIDNFEIEFVINYGVVGGLNNNLELRKCVIVKDVIHYDFDVSKIDKVPVGYYESFKTQYLNLNYDLLKSYSLGINLPLVRCASGDKFIINSKIKEELFKKYNADICDMELAGICLTCLLNNVKIISIKAISDTIYGGAEDYLKFAKEASEEAFDIVRLLLNKLN